MNCIDQEEGDGWKLYHGDCCRVIEGIPDNSIDLSVYSPPFVGLYIYSAAAEDLGNCDDNKQFFDHYRYLVAEQLRATVPGRLSVVHCKDLPMYRNRDGECGLIDFPGQIIRLHEECGWTYHSRVTIWKCPVVERERTNNNGLLHATLTRDSSQVRQGMADYLVVFRKPPVGDNLSDKPIERPNGITEWPGAAEFDPRQNDFHPSRYARKMKAKSRPDTESIRIWQRLADPVWWHIDQMDVLNYQIGKDDKDEKHICPLQLGVIREAVELWSAPGDVVFSPFAGIGSEGHVSLSMGRRFIGSELKDSYYRVACRNLAAAEKLGKQKCLFSGVAEVGAA